MQAKYLVKVEPGANNNKFYRMIPCGDTFRVEYGRIGNPGFQTDNYPIGKWDSQLKSKIKKGYVDQTGLVSEIIDSGGKKEYKEIDDSIISRIVKTLQSFARQSVEENYTISSAKVTQKMVDEAQFILDEISKSQTVESFNKYLVELFKTIPRKMKNVSDNLAKNISDFSEIVTREQDLLDTMRSQVVQKVVLDDSSIDSPNKTILEHLGLVFERINYDDELLIKKNLGNISDRFKFAWKVKNIKTQKAFDAFTRSENIVNKKLLWHGSRNENWWSIVNTGLILRPNAIITGKMFGMGIYLSNDAGKSSNYTSLSGSYWSKGKDSQGYMALYDTAYGKPYDVYSFNSMFYNFDYTLLQKTLPGAHCLHAHGGTGMLKKDEIVVYKEEQITIKYLVEIK